MTRNLDTADRDKVDAEIAGIERKLALEKAKEQQGRTPAPPRTQPVSSRRANLPPRPAGWGDAGASTQDALLVHKTLSGGGQRLSAVDSA